ncbi:SH3 domain-binding protein 5-like [Carassius gibelio]|uniref:SH3 domain-binding protein 5-like n=1 Tax=Carassius gibelio TaxID=101364 RepID=UPI00227978D1|nr:SH3 domain-binding protein 5-like [Carassius gibelio]XP_052409037.1 SH3 domain-binding protein 5-like [Carassius gibelio]XP_052409038.1 SH3 domain-binding protein 5-like [Carassius gibelio]
MDPAVSRESPAGSGEPSAEERGGNQPEEVTEDSREADGESEETEVEGKDSERSKSQDEDSIHEKLTEEELDPRIQEELERLNEASVEINKMELELQEVRSSHRRIMNESVLKLKAKSSELGSCIEKARPYYEARRKAKEAQQETQKAALSFERAVSMHSAAREMVHVAEQGLTAVKTLDPTWQEMLNHATSKVNEAEEERMKSEREHMRVTQLCQEAEARVQELQKSLKRSIVKSKSYFELKVQFNDILEEHKSKILLLEERISQAKLNYSSTLRHLEQISEEIHAQREQVQPKDGPINTCGGRSPPVGAETVSSTGTEGGACGGYPRPNDWVDVKESMANAREWVETHKNSRWVDMGRADVTRAASDSLSIVSLQTIISDLQKCDSVDHLGRLSSDFSLSGEEGERDGLENDNKRVRHKTTEISEEYLKQHIRSVSL